jgi:hypothetical protein
MSFLVAMSLTPCGPFSHLRTFLYTSPLLSCVIYPPPHFRPGGPSPVPMSSHHLSHILLLFHISLSPKGESSRLLPPSLHLMSSVVFPSSLTSPICPYNPVPSFLSCASSSALASILVPQAIQLFQVAAQEVVHIPKC